MTGRPLVGLLCALFVEAKYWLRIRWSFNDSSYESAWQLSFILMVLTAFMIWLDESRYTAVLVMMGWLPPIIMPLQFVQGYGMRNSVQLTAFSMLARRSRKRSERLGLIHNPVRFNFGNVTFIVTLVSSAIAMKADSRFFIPGLLILICWMLMATGRCRLGSLIPVLILAGIMGFAGQFGLEYLERLVRQGGGIPGTRYNPNFQSTQIGKRGRVLQNPDIVWRLSTKPGEAAPELLRTSTFTNYTGQSWRNQSIKLTELNGFPFKGKNYDGVLDEIEADDLRGLPEFKIRGTVDRLFPLPVPGDVVALNVRGDAVIKRNATGTIQVEPTVSVVDAEVRWGGKFNVDGETGKADLREDKLLMYQIVDELGLNKLPDLQSKLRVLKDWYDSEFRYTLDLTISSPSSAMREFLTEVRAGHCEYFATSATLLLRAAGIPARYAVGYAVVEQTGANEYVIRGTHGHAWCRVWDEENQRWLDFDPTPVDWLGSSASQVSWMQRVKDKLKEVREDFFLWRTNPDNEPYLVGVISLIGLGLGLVVFRRLWRSRSSVGGSGIAGSYEGDRESTPLHRLESLAKRCLGKRPTGYPYGQWLMGLEERWGRLESLSEAVELHQQWRFDPQPLEESKRDRLGQLVDELEISLRAEIKKAEA